MMRVGVVGSNAGEFFYFIRDVQAGGCWLAGYRSEAMTLAPAPVDSCANVK
jgi:hypothetical protein